MTPDRPASPEPPHTPELLILSRKKAEACAILRVAFSDIDQPSDDPSEVLFNERHAGQVTDFVRHWTHVDRIVVHCMAGQSRSPGIALGLCELFSWETGDLEERYPFWNPWVRSVLVRVGRERFK